MKKYLPPIFAALACLTCIFTASVAAQNPDIAKLEKEPETTSSAKSAAESAAEAKRQSRIKYRRLQSAAFFVETAYHQDGDELQHTFKLIRDREHYWAASFLSEIPLGSYKDQLSVSVPAQFVSRGGSIPRGAGDTEIEYSRTVIGNNVSRVTVSPTVGVSLPTGSYRRDLGYGTTGIKFSVPASYVITPRLGASTNVGVEYFRKAKNESGERANLTNFELGQSIAWYAKPNLNLLVEAVWERSQRVAGDNLKEQENEVFVSPGVRWAHTFRNGATIIPGFAVPVGVGPSRGNNGVFFYLAFEHRFRKEED